MISVHSSGSFSHSLSLTPLLCFSVCIQLHFSLSLSTSISLSLSFCLPSTPNLSISLSLSHSLFLPLCWAQFLSPSLSRHQIPFLTFDVYTFLTHCPSCCIWLQIFLSLSLPRPASIRLCLSLPPLCLCPAASLSLAVRLYLSWWTGWFLWGLHSDMLKWS